MKRILEWQSKFTIRQETLKILFIMEYIVDVQGFKRAYNEFVLTELAIISLLEEAQPTVYLFESPHDWNFLDARYKCHNKWLTKNYHGINWQDGEIPYKDLEDILKSSLRCW